MNEQEKRQRKPAFGYTRTSSATNLGEDKDSVPRQRRAIQSYANRAGSRATESWFALPFLLLAQWLNIVAMVKPKSLDDARTS